MSQNDDQDQAGKGNGSARDEEPLGVAEGVEVVTLADESGRGVYLTCAADLSTTDLVEGLCELVAQVTRAALARPEAKRAGDLGLGDDVF